MVHSGILAVPAGAPSCDAHRALETIDVAVLVGREAERQDPGAEIAVSLIEIPRECLRRRGLIAGPHAHHDREENAVDISGVQKGSIRDRDAHPGLRLIASADEIIVRSWRGAVPPCRGPPSPRGRLPPKPGSCQASSLGRHEIWATNALRYAQRRRLLRWSGS